MQNLLGDLYLWYTVHVYTCIKLLISHRLLLKALYKYVVELCHQT